MVRPEVARQPRGRPGPVLIWRPAVLRCVSLLPRDPGLSTGWTVWPPAEPLSGLLHGLMHSLPVACLSRRHPSAALWRLAVYPLTPIRRPNNPHAELTSPIPARLDQLRLWLWLADVPPGFVDGPSCHFVHVSQNCAFHAGKKNRPKRPKMGKIRGGYVIQVFYSLIYT